MLILLSRYRVSCVGRSEAPRKAVCSDCQLDRPRRLASALAIHYSSAELQSVSFQLLNTHSSALGLVGRNAVHSADSIRVKLFEEGATG
jgi:hypothetical protein